jgi:ERF superfamily
MTKPKPKPNRAVVVKLPVPQRTMLQVIAEATMNPAVDVEKMKALMEMQRTLQQDEADRVFTRDFNGLQHELPSIRRDGKISHAVDDTGMTRSGKRAMTARYATYPNIMSVIGPLFKKYGFTLSNVVEPSADNTRIVVVGTLEHIEGGKRVTRFPITIDTTGKKNNQQGWGSAQQYAMRYNAIALLNIVSRAPEDDDRDGFDQSPKQEVVDPETGEVTEDPISSGPKLISKAQFAKLVEAIADCGVGDKAVLDKYRIKKLTDLPAEMLKDVLAACANYKAAKQKQKAASDFPGDRPMKEGK